MEDSLKQNKNGRQPKKNGRQPQAQSKKYITGMQSLLTQHIKYVKLWSKSKIYMFN